MRSPLLWIAAGALTLALPSCQKKPPSYGPSEAQIRTDRLGKLRNEILALTPPTGCDKAAECKVIGVGYNRCGGPRQHVVYCGKGADEAALREKTDELHKLEEEEAQLQGEPPPCKKAEPPQVELASGSCRARQ
jgi:hypothetical protein